MKETTVNNLCKIQKLTSEACAKDGFGCCSNYFCEVAEMEAKALGYEPKRVADDIPFLGEKGCVIPAEFRPGCTMYVCPVHLENRKFRRQWDKHRQKVLSDPVINEKITNNKEINEKILAVVNDPDLAEP